MPYDVPFFAQIASPEWISPIFDAGCDPTWDPAWNTFGTEDAALYRYWAPRACGIACVKMVVEALGGPLRSMMNWVELGLEREGYLLRREPDGSLHESGWKHSALADLLTSAGFPARSVQTNPTQMVGVLRQEKPIIVSISYELGTDRPVTHNNGHMGVVTGCDLIENQPVAVYLHNPSGRTTAMRIHARIPIDQFSQGFSGRAIFLD
ncbi:MAG: C39 family peptidase [Anaerolineaceae bacterium]|nr:C39 family peptidase [Anaerolineaceae bacterium]